MFFHNSIEEKIKQNEKKIREMDISFEKLSNDVSNLMAELPLSIEKINEHLEDPSNFSAEEWEKLQKLRTDLDEKLHHELANIRNPIKSKKASDLDRHVQRHWLHVR